jgi:hypothetical protein
LRVTRIVPAAIVLAAWITAPARAADHHNLEEGLPTQVEDAYVVGRGARELQAMMRYERTDESKNRITLDPRFEFGLWNNLQAKISVPFYVGNASRTGSGNIDLELFYNFNTEGLVLPAFAVSLRGKLPTGTHSRGVDTTLKAIATKSITRTGLDRVHLNASWEHNGDAWPDEREHSYHVVVGYSRRITADSLMVADFVRESLIERGAESNVVEAGVRTQLTPLTVLAAGIGAGIGDESPKVRVTLGLQYSF